MATKRLDESIGTVEYDKLFVSNFPVADVVTVKLTASQGVVKRGAVIAGTPGGSDFAPLAAAADGTKALFILADDVDTAAVQYAAIVRVPEIRVDADCDCLRRRLSLHVWLGIHHDVAVIHQKGAPLKGAPLVQESKITLPGLHDVVINLICHAIAFEAEAVTPGNLLTDLQKMDLPPSLVVDFHCRGRGRHRLNAVKPVFRCGLCDIHFAGLCCTILDGDLVSNLRPPLVPQVACIIEPQAQCVAAPCCVHIVIDPINGDAVRDV